MSDIGRDYIAALEAENARLRDAIQDMLDSGPTEWGDVRRAAREVGIETTPNDCDEPGCSREATCGTPTPDGYRRTCGDHRPGDSP